jgi:hypothetical protein
MDIQFVPAPRGWVVLFFEKGEPEETLRDVVPLAGWNVERHCKNSSHEPVVNNEYLNRLVPPDRFYTFSEHPPVDFVYTVLFVSDDYTYERLLMKRLTPWRKHLYIYSHTEEDRT